MSQPVALVALTAFTHEGRALRPGEVVETDLVSATRLAQRRLVRLATPRDRCPAGPPPPSAPDVDPETERPRRRYRRRDLEAEA
jgi:hypothetical protein